MLFGVLCLAAVLAGVRPALLAFAWSDAEGHCATACCRQQSVTRTATIGLGLGAHHRAGRVPDGRARVARGGRLPGRVRAGMAGAGARRTRHVRRRSASST